MHRRMLLALSLIACSGASRSAPEHAGRGRSVRQSAPAHSPPTSAPGGAARAPAPPSSSARPGRSGTAKAETPHGTAPTSGAEAKGGADTTRAGSCPAGMKLVEGDYCTEVEQHCLREWYDESNKKRICEEFEPKSVCTGSRVHKRYCIDTYEWPNVRGERPEVMNNFYQAQVKCAAVGKRMCTESEWTFACEGPSMKPFPYGYLRDPAKCNGDHPWDSPKMPLVAERDPSELARLWKGVRSGSQPQCISDFGVADLPANTDEVVSNESFGIKKLATYSSVNTGGPWYKGVRNQCRPKIYTHDEGFYYYYLSFRCCAAPDGATNDPRTPVQIQRGQSFDYVERLARFSVRQMREKLALKADGRCTCKDSDTLCKTMCGTLLGPGAVDARQPHTSP